MLSRQEWQKWGGAIVTLGTASLQPITHEKYWLILRGRVGSVGPAPSDPEGLAKIESGQWQQQGGWPNNRYLTFAPVPFGIAWQLYDVCPGFLFGCQGISSVCQCESWGDTSDWNLGDALLCWSSILCYLFARILYAMETTIPSLAGSPVLVSGLGSVG